VTSGQASLGGDAQVYILQQNKFPANMPQYRIDGRHNDFWLLLYLMKDRMRDRGWKFWKAMAGICYVPFHSVAVVPLIQNYMLDLAADPANGGSYGRIHALLCIQFVSLLIYRWGDWEQTNNRGRTGGVRQVLRRQLLTKMLMMDYTEQCQYPGSDWFYAMLENVESITVDAYWQVFSITQSVLGLTIALGVLLFKACIGGSFQISAIMPAVLFIIITPISGCLLWSRKHQIDDYIDRRMALEERWVKICSWLAGHIRSAYTFSMTEMAEVDLTFLEKSRNFLQAHWAARDFSNDTYWTAQWLGDITNLMILAWASFMYYDYESGASSVEYSAGDFVLVLKVFSYVAKYASKLTKSLVSIVKGSRSINKVARLLALTENKALEEDEEWANKDVEDSNEVFDPSAIVFKDVHYDARDSLQSIPRAGEGGSEDINRLGMMASLRQTAPFELPLGKIVFLKGGAEMQRLTVLALIGKALRGKGQVQMPRSEKAILLMSAHDNFPDMKVKDNFEINGASSQFAQKMAQAFGIEAHAVINDLAPGKKSAQSILRCLMRDPTIVLAVSPWTSVPIDDQEHMQSLLLTWQLGGGKTALEGIAAAASLSESHEQIADSERAKRTKMSKRAARRTLIITGEQVPTMLSAHPELYAVCDISEAFNLSEQSCGSGRHSQGQPSDSDSLRV